jgi:2-iminoacetate synthase ThiH
MSLDAAPHNVPASTAADVRRAVEAGRRLTRDEALHALTDMPLLELGELAQVVRFRKNPEKRVTYVIDSNPNYTNVCTVDCTFCAFYRKPQYVGDDVYTLDIEQVLEHVERAQSYGCTTVLLQGGLNPAVPWEFYPALIHTFISLCVSALVIIAIVTNPSFRPLFFKHATILFRSEAFPMLRR